MSVIVFDEMHEYQSEEIKELINKYHAELRRCARKEVAHILVRLYELWEKLKELLPEHPEVIHPAAKLKQSKQRIHSLVTIRKPMMIRARTCC